MKRFLVTACGYLLLPLFAQGHVGSPNVFFEGHAGPHPVRVIIRPPPVLPGMAQVDVRVASEGVQNVSLQAALWEPGGGTAPAPISAALVRGETNLFNAALWLLYSGSYSIHVTVESRQGRGSVVVPLNSAATQRPTMTPTLIATLAALGVLMFIGAVWLAGAAARDSMLEPGAIPTPRESTRARVVAISTVLLLAVTIYALTGRWRTMDREFRNNALYKPLPVVATVRTNGSLRLLHLTPPQDSIGAPGWDTLVADHGKLMHLFLMHEPDFDAFAHLHPVRRDARTFESVLPPLPAGVYRLYAEVTHENGLNQTLTAQMTLAGPTGRAPQLMSGSNMLNEVFCLSPVAPTGDAPQPFALDADDSWHSGPAFAVRPATRMQVSRLMGGASMVFQDADGLIENQENSLRFAVYTPEGQPVRLQPYMGMLGHAVVRRADGEVFTHLHPVGTISMAAQELLMRREPNAPDLTSGLPATNAQPTPNLRSPGDAGAGHAGNQVSFPYAFPRPGDYRLWVQVRTDRRVLTGVFDVRVKVAK